ncbi:MAG: type III-B CRISPR module RAMP protein Cmr6 [Mycobacteriaceae bacterium]
MSQRYGVLSRLDNVDDKIKNKNLNQALLFHRLWLGPDDSREKQEHLQSVTEQTRNLTDDFFSSLTDRRKLLAKNIAQQEKYSSLEIIIKPMWRMVVGHGGESVQETDLSFSSPYGFPYIPATAIKGVAAAYARECSADVELRTRIFGFAANQEDRNNASVSMTGCRGSITILDAYPESRPKIVVDVLTPHVVPYYNEGNADGGVKSPPAEYYEPVPVQFLAVHGGSYSTWVSGTKEDVEIFYSWVEGGCGYFGLGGKTAAGYGYCTVEKGES